MNGKTVNGFYLRAWAGLVVMAMLCASGNEVRAATPPAIYKIGTEAALGDFSVTLNDAVLVPAEQGTILDLKYTIRNISPAPVSLARFPALALEDRNGGVYNPIAGGKPGDRLLAPGEQVSASVAFPVPKGSSDPMTWLLRLGGDQAPRVTLR